MNSTVAKNIRLLRAVGLLSRKELSEEITRLGFEMSIGTITRIELGQKAITVDELKLFSKVFKVPITSLISESFGDIRGY